MAEEWVKQTLKTATCRDCGGENLISIEDKFPVREVMGPDGSIQRYSPRECSDCHKRFDVITLDNVVIGWSGKDVDFLDTPPALMTRKEAWDMGIRHGFKNPYKNSGES